MSQVATIGKAVAAAVNAGGVLPEGTTAAFKWRPNLKLKEMAAGLFVTVVPKTLASDEVARHTWQPTVTVDLAVQTRVSSDDETDAAAGLVDQIRTLLEQTTITGATLVEVRADPVYDPQHLVEMGVFTGLLTLAYAVTA